MKKLLLSLLCLISCALPSLAATKQYQLCTDINEILNPDNQFVMVRAKVASSKIAVATTTIGSSGSAKATTISCSTTYPPETLEFDVEADGIGLYSFKPNGTNLYSLYENVKGNYLLAPASGNNMNSSTSLPTDDEGKLKVSVDASNHNGVKMEPSSPANKVFVFNQNTYFRCYASSNLTNATYSLPLFYKEVQLGPITPTYSNYEEEYTIAINETMDFPSIRPADLSYSFSSSDPAIVEVDNDAKTIKGLAEGQATITFNTGAVENEFLAGSGSFIVNVTKITPTMSFRDELVYGKTSVGVVWEPVIISDPEDPELRGELTYSSSDPSVVTIDPTSGQILPTDVHAAGEAVITCTMAPKGDYAEGTASYKIIIIDPTETVGPSRVEFDFTSENPYGMTTQTSGSTYEKNVKSVTSDNDLVSISFKGNYRSWKLSNGYELRLQKNASFIVEVPEGYKISKIGLVATDDKGSKVPGTYSPVGNSEESGDGTGITEANSTWLPKDNTPVTEVTYSTGPDNTTNVSMIYVLYEAANSDLKSADLSFNTVINSIYMEEPTILNAVNNPFNREITYRIENLDESEYTIDVADDGKQIEVTINQPGYYSLQATSPADSEYRDGFAIMRVNVYRHLNVYVNGQELGTDVINTNEEAIVTMDVPELVNLYYQIVTDDTPAVTAEGDNDEDPNCEPGFELYDTDITIPADTNGKLVFYIANYGYKSPKREIELTVAVGVNEIGVAEETAPRYFDLTGREIKNPAAGIYIRLRNNKAEKVIIK